MAVLKLHKTVPTSPTFLHYDPEIDGVTNGLLQNWGGCRERARLHIRGYTKRQASFALAYGDLTHWLFQHVYEDHRKHKLPITKAGSLDSSYVSTQLKKLEAIWRKENPMAGQDALQHMELTMLLNEQVMPFYFEHWKKDFKEIQWVGLESEFRIPFEVRRNGITYKTFLRGKRDGVYKDNGLWLFETKTKSRIDEGTMQDILAFESQVNFYMVSLWREFNECPRGLRYNIIRRPGLRQKVRETLPEFARRISDDIMTRPNWYFMRHKMKITERELDVFVGDLEDRVWEFVHWAKGLGGHWRESSQCENKYGVCQFLSICSRRDFAPFFIRDRVFGELAGEVE